jgi:hypothetical protein
MYYPQQTADPFFDSMHVNPHYIPPYQALQEQEPEPPEWSTLSTVIILLLCILLDGMFAYAFMYMVHWTTIFSFVIGIILGILLISLFIVSVKKIIADGDFSSCIVAFALIVIYTSVLSYGRDAENNE